MAKICMGCKRKFGFLWVDYSSNFNLKEPLCGDCASKREITCKECGAPYKGQFLAGVAPPCPKCSEESQVKKEGETGEVTETDRIDSSLLQSFQSKFTLAENEEIFFFQKTNSSPKVDAKMSGFPTNYHLLATNKRVVAFARDKKGRDYSERLEMGQVKKAEVVRGWISNTLELVVANPDEQLLQFNFTVAVKPAVLDALVEFIKECRGGFEEPQAVQTTSGALKKAEEEELIAEEKAEQRKKDIKTFKKEWEENKARILTELPSRLPSGGETVIGARHPDFEDWIQQNLGQDEKTLARCYSVDEALVVTDEKVVLLKKGAAKAAVSASGAGVGDAVGTAAVLGSGSLLGAVVGMAAGAIIDYGIGAQGVIAKSIDYYNLTSIDCTKGMALGHIEFTYPGAREVRTGGFVEGAISENVFHFSKDLYDYVVQLANEIRRRIKIARQPQQVVAQPQVVSDSIPDQIKKLHDLKEAGILTEEEFEKKKKELLDRM